MGLKSDLTIAVNSIFQSKWEEREGNVVPSDDSLKLSNDAIKLNAVVLYADMADSTKLVDNFKPAFAAEIYKTFLLCAAKIIRSEGGEITAYDGDRIMAVYIGNRKNTGAAKSALKINFAARNIIEPSLLKQYPKTAYRPKHVVGIDASELLVARTGIRGANDLVWVGKSANYAAKLASLPDTYASYITKSVYDDMLEEGRTSLDGRPMWEEMKWDAMGGLSIYRSNWTWSID